ncbi:MAG: chemotaxis protein [Defluviitaleaceae bacterium]|nr:chemotaxis protein [Defluviitaleaceae bacterium]
MPERRKHEILLESGTNELEILEFTIDGRFYGINVAKIVELMKYHEVTPMPNANPFVEGVFNPRGLMMTLINLPAYLGHPESPDVTKDIFIVTNFNKVLSAFHVHAVEEIHRLSWDMIEKPDAAIYGGQDGLATGIARVKDKLITILDFEKVLADISPESGIQLEELSKLGKRDLSDKPILMADDSQAINKALVEALGQAGYTNLTMLQNGQEAWDALQSFKATGEPIENFVKLIVTDVEMPKMDGHRLLKLIRNDESLRHLPVIIFSSTINEQMRVKGESLGATAQLAKPDLLGLVQLIDQNVL